MDTKPLKRNQKFFSAYPIKKFMAGQVILRSGDVPEGIYFIKQGLVRVYALSKIGDEVSVNIFKPESFFQLSWSLNREPNRYYYQAVIPTTVHIAPMDEVLDFLNNEPDVMKDINRRLLSGLDGITRHMEQLLQGTAEAKVVHSLLLLAYRIGETINNQVVIHYPFTHQELASMAGTSRETVSRIMSSLKKQNYIEKQGKAYIITNMPALEALL